MSYPPTFSMDMTIIIIVRMTHNPNRQFFFSADKRFLFYNQIGLPYCRHSWATGSWERHQYQSQLLSADRIHSTIHLVQLITHLSPGPMCYTCNCFSDSSELRVELAVQHCVFCADNWDRYWSLSLSLTSLWLDCACGTAGQSGSSLDVEQEPLICNYWW